MSENFDNRIVLTDENGEDVEFEFIDLFVYREKEYVVLMPIDEADDEVVILRVDATEDEDTESYVSVDDEETLVAVFELFKEKYKSEFNFVD